MEYFYQVKKRNQKYPFAQVLGRTDFAIFPVAGYLCVGAPDNTALLFFLFFYPLALSHLGLNDLIDVKNDIVRKMNAITVLYGIKGTVKWIIAFNLIHFVTAVLFLSTLSKATFFDILNSICIRIYWKRRVCKSFHYSIIIDNTCYHNNFSLD